MAFIVCLDACVLVPAALKDTLLRAAEAYFYTPIWSQEILDELRRALVEDLGKTPAQAEYLEQQMKVAFPEALIGGYQSLVPAMTVNEKDRHVAAAAVAGHAQVIVTLNLGHFPQQAMNPYEVEVQSPDDFLESLADLDEDRMIQIIVEQAKALKAPSHTPLEICDHLAKTVPKFAQRMRRRLS